MSVEVLLPSEKMLIHKITVGLAPAKLTLLYLQQFKVCRMGRQRSDMTGLIDLSTRLISATVSESGSLFPTQE